MSLPLLRLLPRFDPRPWGRRDLAPFFPAPPEPIGEVWFHERNETHRGGTLEQWWQRHGGALVGSAVRASVFPILVKFIFTAERLSIQVHPDDDYAQRAENQWGKIEMWYVLEAQPGAQLALGLRQSLTPEAFCAAARSGEIERLVHWIEVRPGDLFLIYPGTVHALGPGVVLAEIQQNSDLTYRIYDYGRPRELHLEKAAAVARLGPYPGSPAPVELEPGRRLLARTRYFATELIETGEPQHWSGCPEHFYLLLFLSGQGRLGAETFQAGQCWLVPAAAEPFDLQPAGPVRLLRVYPPEPLTDRPEPHPANR